MNENTKIPISTWISFMSSFQYFFHVEFCMKRLQGQKKGKKKKKKKEKMFSSTTLATFLTFLLKKI